MFVERCDAGNVVQCNCPVVEDDLNSCTACGALSTCVECDYNTYQDIANPSSSVTCKACPAGRGTRTRGASRSSQCEGENKYLNDPKFFRPVWATV